jgi:hypothetical protein
LVAEARLFDGMKLERRDFLAFALLIAALSSRLSIDDLRFSNLVFGFVAEDVDGTADDDAPDPSDGFFSNSKKSFDVDGPPVVVLNIERYVV